LLQAGLRIFGQTLRAAEPYFGWAWMWATGTDAGGAQKLKAGEVLPLRTILQRIERE
jgi:hypothetical protein